MNKYPISRQIKNGFQPVLQVVPSFADVSPIFNVVYNNALLLFGFTNTVATVGIVQMYLFLQVFKGSWRYLQDSAYLFSDNSKVMRTHERHKQATAGDGLCICYVPPPALSCTTLSLYSCRSVC